MEILRYWSSGFKESVMILVRGAAPACMLATWAVGICGAKWRAICCFTIWPLGASRCVCKTYVAAPLTISTIGELILRTFSFRRFPNIFRPSQLDPHFTNSSSKNDRAIAPSLTLTYPERCASKFCVRTCQKLTRIFHLRSNRDEKVGPSDSKIDCRVPC